MDFRLQVSGHGWLSQSRGKETMLDVFRNLEQGCLLGARSSKVGCRNFDVRVGCVHECPGSGSQVLTILDCMFAAFSECSCRFQQHIWISSIFAGKLRGSFAWGWASVSEALEFLVTFWSEGLDNHTSLLNRS